MVSRAQRTALANWWWTVDRWLLAALAILVVAGMILTMAASPAVAERINLPTFHFVDRQAIALIPAIAVLIAVSFLTPRQVRRMAIIVFVGLDGAHPRRAAVRPRGQGLAPLDLRHPAVGIPEARLRHPRRLGLLGRRQAARRARHADRHPAVAGSPIIPLMLQPDFGQTMLVSLVWMALFFMAGLHWFWVFGLGGFGVSGVFLAYKFVPHVRARILKFMDPSPRATASPTPFRSTPRSRRSRPAAGSARARAKAP